MNNNCYKENSQKAQDIIELKDFLRVMSDTNRMRIICLLSRKDLCVCEIFRALKLSQNLVSHHLAKLEKLSLVGKRKEGTFIIYNINKENLTKYKKLFNQII